MCVYIHKYVYVYTYIHTYIYIYIHIYIYIYIGVMITYASYNPPSFPIVSNVLLVSAVNSGTELFAGFCVFSILGYLANYRGVPIQEVVKGGPGLVFEVIPEAIALMPSKGVFAFLFFFM